MSSDNIDPDKYLFNKKIEEIDSPYLSVKNFITMSEQLSKYNFSILHLNIRSLNANIDKLREFLASLKENFSFNVLTEFWCNETVNENS